MAGEWRDAALGDVIELKRGYDLPRQTRVKRILRKRGYPPDKQEQATRTVLKQAEALSQEWAVA